MDRADIVELHFITPIASLSSILEHGILSNRRAARFPHKDLAMKEIQARRKDKPIRGTDKHLHDHANLYFDAHNPMLSRVRGQNDVICILRISTAVLDLDGVIVSDRNASSDWARFFPVKEGLAAINKEVVYSRYWPHPENPFKEMEHKSIKCAEVLVPDKVEPSHILGVYVANNKALEAFRKLEVDLSVQVKSDIFF